MPVHAVLDARDFGSRYLSCVSCMPVLSRGIQSSLRPRVRSSFGLCLRSRGDKLLAREMRLPIEDRSLLEIRSASKTLVLQKIKSFRPQEGRERVVEPEQ